MVYAFENKIVLMESLFKSKANVYAMIIKGKSGAFHNLPFF